MVALSCVLTFAGVMTTVNMQNAAAVPPFPISDATNGSAGAIDPNWSYVRTPTSNLAGNTYTKDGWLRLTNAATGQATNILNNTAFPSSTGFQVSFDFRQSGGIAYKGQPGENSGTGDGIAMYLVDGSQTKATAGAPGSGLGYAAGGTGQTGTAGQTCSTPGVSGGYLGLGLDAFGNFASPNFGNGGGQNLGGSEIGLRGSGNGCQDTYANRYHWVTGTPATLRTGPASTTTGGTDPAGVANSQYKRVSITVVPSPGQVQVTVAMSALKLKTDVPGPMTQVFQGTLYDNQNQVPIPATLKLGFSASTGAATDFHDIRNIQVASLTDTSITKALSKSTQGQNGYPTGTFMPGDPISFDLTATNNGPTEISAAPNGVARVFDDLSSLPISGVSWKCSAVGGATCANGSGGTGPVVSQDWTGPAGSSVTVTVKGNVTASPGSYTNTAILPTDFANNAIDPDNPWAQADGGNIDTNLANNTASAGFTVIAPHFTQVKTANKASYAVGEPITYTVLVTNDGTGTGTATFTDQAPAGVTFSSANCVGAGGTQCSASVVDGDVTGLINAPANGTATFTITGTVTGGTGVTDVKNTATVGVTTPDCTPDVCGGGDTTTSNLPLVTPSLSLTKTATVDGSPTSALVVGQIVTYNYLVENTGATPMEKISINEDSFNGSGALSTPTCPVDTLAVGASTTCTATYQVTQADVNAGIVTNIADAQGNVPGVDTPTVSGKSTATMKTIVNPVLTLAKNANVNGDPVDKLVLDQVIDYTFTVTNTGNVTMSGIHVDENSFTGSGPMSDVICPVDTLAPGESEDCTASYTVTQKDVDQSGLTNTAYAFGTAPGAANETQSNLGKVGVPVDQEPSIEVTKSASLADGVTTPQAGDIVNFTISVVNTGNVSLTDFDVEDSMQAKGLSALAFRWPATPGILAPGSTVVATATYTLTQADVDAGSVTNKATVTADDPAGGTVNGDDTVTVPLTAKPGLALQKIGALAPDSKHQAGDTVTYAFKATNTGNVTLTGVAISDPLLGGTSISYVWPHTNGEADGTLAPGDVVTGTATYTVTQADIDAGNVHNDATVTGTPPTPVPTPDDPTPTAPDSPEGDAHTDVPLTADPSLSLVKTATLDVDPDTAALAGDEIDYSFTITNTGNVTLEGVDISDKLPGLSDISYVWPHIDGEADGTLAPGEQATATATYALTQADVDAGGVTNTATVTGNPPPVPATPDNPNPEQPEPPSDSSTITVTVDPAPEVDVIKFGELDDTTNPPMAGDIIDYTFLVTNSGNVTLTHINIDDPLLGASPDYTYDWSGAAIPNELGPGESVVVTATYKVTQAQIDAGSVENSVTVSGTPPTGDAVTGTDTNNVSLQPAPSLALVKTGALAPGDTGFAGDEIQYTFEITNDGNVTLTGVTISDLMPNLSDISYVWPHNDGEADGTLAPGDVAYAHATYTLTQADVDAGTVHNDASVTGTPPPVTPTPDDPNPTPTPRPTGDGGTDVPVPPAPSLTVHKSASEADGSTVQDLVLGDTITYSFVVNNTGNVTMSDIAIDDSGFTGTGAMSAISCPAGPLAPGASVTCTATYVVTQDDVDSGQLDNTATGSGTPPAVTPPDGGPAVDQPPVDSPPDTVTVPTVMAPELTVTKKYNLSGIGRPVQAGDVINYTVKAQNTGNVTLHGVTVDDPMAGGDITDACTWPDATNPGKLIPGQSATCTAQYALSQTDIDTGTVNNIATATGTDPAGDDTTGTGNVTTDLTKTPGYGPGLTVDKTADDSGLQQPAQVGDPVVYTVTATNTGDLTLTGVTLTDPMLGGDITGDVTWPGAVGTLLPNQSVTATLTYKLTQDDIDAGEVTNEAFAQGTPPSTPDNPDPTPTPGGDTVTTDIPSSPGISLVKTGSIATNPAMAGDDVTFDFTATNTGNVTLTSVDIVDTMPGLSSVSYGDWPGGPAAVGVLKPGESVDATATYTLKQADVDAGNVANSATVTAQPPTPADPNAPTPPSVGGGDEVNVPVPDAPALQLEKLASGTDGNAVSELVAGETIDYYFVVTNTGNVTMSGIDIDEQAFTGTGAMSAINCPSDPIAPGDAVICSATYAVTQADVDSGDVVSNTAIGTGKPPAQTPPDGGTPTDPPTIESPPDTVTVPGDPTPGLSLNKTGKLADGATGVAGDVVEYTFTATNTGNITLKDVSITDQMAGLSDIQYTWPGADGTLWPGQQMTATATYTLTQADVDAGGVHNSAIVSNGNPPDGNPSDVCDDQTACGGDNTDVPVTARPELDMVKTASLNGGPAANMKLGQVVDYTFTVTNTGNVTMSGIGITEQKFTGSGMTPGAICPADVLAPGDSMDCTASYKVTQADVDAGQVSNTAVAVGTPPSLQTDPDGNLVLGDCPDCVMTTPTPITSQPSTAIATMDPNPALSIVKTANVSTFTTGTVITYTFTITNTGDVTMSNVGVIEGAFNGTGKLSSITCPTTTLAPGQVVACTATYTATAADAAAGKLANTATATGVPPTNGATPPAPIQSPPSPVTIKATPVVVQTGGTLATGAGAALPLGLVIVALLALGASLQIASKKGLGRQSMRKC